MEGGEERENFINWPKFWGFKASLMQIYFINILLRECYAFSKEAGTHPGFTQHHQASGIWK